MKVPFVDLQTQFQDIRSEVLPKMEEVMRNSSFILGEDVSRFEDEFAEFCGVDHCVGVGSGCDALMWALKATGIGPGDEVITVANTYIATVLAISAVGATPVLVDCLEDTYEVDPDAVSRVITDRTRAILPVHLYGHPAEMDSLLSIAKEHDLIVIEDAAQAHGAEYRGTRCGSMGLVGCFSFYPGKNLGAYGDGGAIVTNDGTIAEKIRQLRNYGQSRKYHHDVIGWNSRLDTLQAVVLRAKLTHLTEWNNARHHSAELYCRLLKDLPVVLPIEISDCRHVYHLFVIRHNRRDELMASLASQGVYCGIHYPIPIHLQSAYASLGYPKGSFPITERISDEILSLPMFPELQPGQVEYVCKCIREFVA